MDLSIMYTQFLTNEEGQQDVIETREVQDLKRALQFYREHGGARGEFSEQDMSGRWVVCAMGAVCAIKMTTDSWKDIGAIQNWISDSRINSGYYIEMLNLLNSPAYIIYGAGILEINDSNRGSSAVISIFERVIKELSDR